MTNQATDASVGSRPINISALMIRIKRNVASVIYYSWNVTNHMRPTISGPDLPYQAPTYNIRPRHTISGPQTKQRFRSCSKRFSPRTASKIHEHFDQQNGTKLFFPQLCFIPFTICQVSSKIVKQRRST